MLEEKNITQRNEEIKTELITKGYTNKSISYQEFLELYEPYKKEMSEVDFAGVLGITYYHHKNIKHHGRKAIILKSKVTEEKKEEIQRGLKQKGYANKLIDYKEFLELYEPYKKEMKETDFAGVLGISYASYQTIKRTEKRAKILKPNKVSEKIIIMLTEKGYVNKLIDYQEFLELYKPYKKEISEVEFASVIGISYGNYNAIKLQGTNARILKTREVTEERKEEIQNILKAEGYANKSISYQEFLELYERYKNEMNEKDFASVIELSLGKYQYMKYESKKTVILRPKEMTEERKEEIQNILKAEGYANKSISYQEFLELYERYKNEIKETEFASVIGISYGNYKRIKNQGANARILKTDRIGKQRKEEIQTELKDKGYANKSIDYKEFLELYEQFKHEMKEKELATIIGITEGNYDNIKRKGQKARVLKQFKTKITEERKIEIQNELKEKGYINKLILYEEFLELYNPYQEEMGEKEFADIIGISYSKHSDLKFKGSNTRMLKTKEITEVRKKQIISELKEKGYAKKLIDYQEFLQLYELYKNEMLEINFANILGISYSHYIEFKRERKRAIILKIENLTEKILIRLKEEGYTNRSINYQEFLEIYEPYKQEMSEKDFASVIGLSYCHYHDVKNKGQKAIILKPEKITEERKAEMVRELKEKGYANKLINYQEFLEIYEPYKEEMSEKDFASVIGILDYVYNNIRSRGQNVTIDFKNTELNRIQHQLKQESREYKREELENLCNQYNVKIYELLVSFYGENTYTDNLMKRDSIYIGKCEIPKEFQQKYAKNLLDTAQKMSRTLTNKYNLKSYCDDLASDVLMYVIKNKGDSVRNSDNDIESLENLSAYMNGAIKKECLKKLRLKNNKSLDDFVVKETNGNRFSKTERYALVKDKSVHFWEDIEEKESQIPDNKKIVMLMRECYDQGMNNVEAIKCITERYGISKEELLKILEQELTKRRKVVKTADGKVYLGEEVE